MRRNAKVDRNQAEIVAALRQAGCTVLDLHRVGQGAPDVAVGRAGKNYFLEIKSERGTLTPDEREWFADWRGQVSIVYDIHDALKVIGAL